MDYLIENTPLEKLKTECLVVSIFEGQNLSPSAATVDTLTDGLISNLFKRGDLEGKVGETLAINYVPDNNIERLLLIGLGKQDEALSRKKFRKALTSVIKVVKNSKIKTMSNTLVETNVTDSDNTWKARQVVEIFSDNCYKFQQCKSIKDPEMILETVQFITGDMPNKEIQQ
jgi:leucyl aminopeptidase